MVPSGLRSQNVLSIFPRVEGAGVPLLDSHNQQSVLNILGRVTRIWVDDETTPPTLLGLLTFNQTPVGQNAAGMIERKELNGVSIGYTINNFQITDGDGRIVNPEVDRLRWGEDNLTFLAVDWMLLEVSLVSVAADPATGVRSFNDRAYFPVLPSAVSARRRMMLRQRMHDRLQKVLLDGYR